MKNPLSIFGQNKGRCKLSENGVRIAWTMNKCGIHFPLDSTQ